MALVSLRLTRPPAAFKRPDIATQWQLMWWRFKRHHMAMIGLSVLALFVFIALFAEVLAPYDPGKRNTRYLAGPPMGVHLIDTRDGFSLGPHVYARASKRDPVTLRALPVVDEPCGDVAVEERRLLAPDRTVVVVPSHPARAVPPVLAAGALLAPGKRIPARELWSGRPAAFMRALDDRMIAGLQLGVSHYVENARHHAALFDGASGA